MSKKYIVETDDETQLIVEIGVNSTGAALIATNPVSYLTPYTEPDLEQVNAEKDALYDEARERGYKEGQARGYQEGLYDAWEAARKIVNMIGVKREDIFGYTAYSSIINKFPAMESIEIIRQYEQEQEVIEFGDEIEFNDREKALVIDVSDEGLSVMTKRGFTHLSNWQGNVIKTGVKCVMIAEYLKKMHEEK